MVRGIRPTVGSIVIASAVVAVVLIGLTLGLVMQGQVRVQDAAAAARLADVYAALMERALADGDAATLVDRLRAQGNIAWLTVAGNQGVLLGQRPAAATDAGRCLARPVLLPDGTAGLMELALRQQMGASTGMLGALVGYLVLDMVLVALMLWWLLTRHVVRPLRSVTEEVATAAARASQGCYDPVPLYRHGRSEVGRLAEALARLLGSLDRERQQLQEEVRLKEEANSQVRSAHREIARAERLATVGRLASGIAHEIGNPVGIMQGYVHMLRRHAAGDARSDDMVRRLETELDRVAGTVRELLEFAQPTAQKVEPVSINPLVAQVWQMLACQTACKGVTPVFELAASLPPVAGNSVQLRQVLVNLMLNATQAMPEGGMLQVRTSAVAEADRRCVLLEVQDSGGGIAADALASVFEPFYTTRESGSGLGLANVQRIVTAVEGRISVVSSPGAGATFSVWLPVYDRITNGAH